MTAAAPVVLLSRNVYASLHDGTRCLVPTDEVDVRLITHPYGGTSGLDPVRFPHVSVCDTNDEEQVLAVLHWLVRRHGARRIVAVHERMLLPAARVRDAHGLPGMDLPTTLLFRDKVAMKRAVAAADAAAVPRFAELRSPADLDAFDWSAGRKVLKSRWGVGAEDVHIVASRAEADAVLASLGTGGDGWEIEEYVEGPMYHCDAVVQDGAVRFAAVSRYLAKPGDFAPGSAAGSMLVDHADPVWRRIRETNARVLRALGLRDGVTHLEVFRTPDDALVLCEVAARPGGGGIDRIVERAYGCNLNEVAYRLQSGVDPRLGDDAATRPARGAWAVLGFYPDDSGASPAPGIPEHRHAALGIAEHTRCDTAGSGPQGVRHCVDYRDRYVVGAADRNALEARLAAVRSAYRSAYGGS